MVAKHTAISQAFLLLLAGFTSATITYFSPEPLTECSPFFPGLFIKQNAELGEAVDGYPESSCADVAFSMWAEGGAFYGPLGRETISEDGSFATVNGTEIRDECVALSGNYYLFEEDRGLLHHYFDECQTIHHFMYRVPSGYCLYDLNKTLCFTDQVPHLSSGDGSSGVTRMHHCWWRLSSLWLSCCALWGCL